MGMVVVGFGVVVVVCDEGGGGCWCEENSGVGFGRGFSRSGSDFDAELAAGGIGVSARCWRDIPGLGLLAVLSRFVRWM